METKETSRSRETEEGRKMETQKVGLLNKKQRILKFSF